MAGQVVQIVTTRVLLSVYLTLFLAVVDISNKSVCVINCGGETIKIYFNSISSAVIAGQ